MATDMSAIGGQGRAAGRKAPPPTFDEFRISIMRSATATLVTSALSAALSSSAATCCQSIADVHPSADAA